MQNLNWSAEKAYHNDNAGIEERERRWSGGSQSNNEGFQVRQQPAKGKAIGFTQQFGNFINPMLIAQLNSDVPPGPNDSFICHARLRSADSGSDCSILRVGGERSTDIYCTLKGHRDVLGMVLKDPVDGKRKLFFIFPDLSVRIAGIYQINLYIQNMSDLRSPVSCITTKPFRIFTSRRYPGREEPTALTKAFCRVGAINLPRLGMGLGYNVEREVGLSDTAHQKQSSESGMNQLTDQSINATPPESQNNGDAGDSIGNRSDDHQDEDGDDLSPSL